jgi:hypothetical protein
MDFPNYLRLVAVNIRKTDFLEADLIINNQAHFEVWACNAKLGVIEDENIVFLSEKKTNNEGVYLLNRYDYDEIPFREIPTIKVFIKLPNESKMYLLFDETIHGYDNLFCNEHNASIPDDFQQISYDGCTLFSGRIQLGMGIDYESEKEDYDFDENGYVHVLNRDNITWEQVKQEGYDYINITFFNEKKDLSFSLDIELA